MIDTWFDEELTPDPDSIAILMKGSKSGRDDRARLEAIRGRIRVHDPRWKVLDYTEVKALGAITPNHRYCWLRLSCEFDPGADARAAKTGYAAAIMSAYLWGTGRAHPRVHSLAPVEVSSGKPRTVTAKIGPSFSIAGTGGSLGGIEADIAIGSIAPIVRGFAGKDERQPYWNLEHHHEAPLYGRRHFWLLVESPHSLAEFSISCRVEADLQTILGRLRLQPKVHDWAQRPRYVIKLE